MKPENDNTLSTGERTLLHDMLNIVGGADGNVQILRDLLKQSQKGELMRELPERLKSVHSALVRIEKLIDERRHQTLILVSPGHMARQVHEITGKVEDEFDEPHLGLNFSAYGLDSDKDERVLYNSVAWRRILQNIVLNSQSANATSLDIVVTRRETKKRASSILFTIADNGSGIPPKILRKLRMGKSVSTKLDNQHEEHGLGIVSIREQVEAMGGSLEIGNNKSQGAVLKLLFRTSKDSAENAS